MRIVTFMSQPGRVGKSTASSNLVAALVARGCHTLITVQVAREIEWGTKKPHADQAPLIRDETRNKRRRLRRLRSSAVRRSVSPDSSSSSAKRPLKPPRRV